MTTTNLADDVRLLGGSGLRVSPLTLGTMTFGDGGWRAGEDNARAIFTSYLVAWGAGKAGAVARSVEGPLTALVPASALQLHPHATVVADEAAAAELTLAGYYRSTWASKPPWQSL